MSSASSVSSSSPPLEERSKNTCSAALTRSRRQNVDYGVRPQLMAQLNNRELHGLDVYRWEDDDLSLRSAAAQARLPYDRMTLQELQLFPEMARSQPSVALFLYVRNRTLVLWQLDPLVELTVETIMKELPEPFNSDTELVLGIHAYLQRYGYINFGVFLKLTNRKLDKKFHIIIIGAGAAGLAAARQLKFFGFDITVLEARNRPCGRVMTLRRANSDLPPADLGAMIIMGIVGNPLITLIQQTACNIVAMNQKCPIYDSYGKLVDSRKDDMIQKSFNRILTTLSYIVHGMGITEIEDVVGRDDDIECVPSTSGLSTKSASVENGQQGVVNINEDSVAVGAIDQELKRAVTTIKKRKISLGEAFQLILNQHELRVQMRRFKYWEKYEELCNKLKGANERMKITRNAIDHCFKRMQEQGIENLGEATSETFSIDFDDSMSEEEFNRKLSLRCLRKCMQMAVTEHDEAEQQCNEIEQVLSDYKNMEPSHVFMNNIDKRVLDFHLANLEYGIGAPLNSVALKDWDQDDPYGFAGSHMTVKEGLGTIIERLCANLNVRMNCIVNQIHHSNKGVSVTYSTKKADNSNQATKNTAQTSASKLPGGKGASSTTIETTTIDGDAVLCTIPLGVLKKSPFLTGEDDIDEPESGSIRFVPPLPAWKREAIGRLGFGSLNKLILFFKKPFWETSRSSFGHLNDTPGSRGELFLFFSNGELPMLIGLFSGEAASITSQLDEKLIVQKAMEVLHRIFGNNCPTEPVNFILSRWHVDRFARGCYSYMAINSIADDYDTLARPVYPSTDVDDGSEEREEQLARVFFAGEHTNRQYPSSVHGAFLSGLREAARIMDTFIGPLNSYGENYLPITQDEYEEMETVKMDSEDSESSVKQLSMANLDLVATPSTSNENSREKQLEGQQQQQQPMETGQQQQTEATTGESNIQANDMGAHQQRQQSQINNNREEEEEHMLTSSDSDILLLED